MAKLAEVVTRIFQGRGAEPVLDGDLMQDTLKVKSNIIHFVTYNYVGTYPNRKTTRLSGCKGGRISKDLMKITCKACLEWIADWTVTRRNDLD
jgi:hypothetical protein